MKRGRGGRPLFFGPSMRSLTPPSLMVDSPGPASFRFPLSSPTRPRSMSNCQRSHRRTPSSALCCHASASSSTAIAALIDWVEESGGLLHPSLQVVDHAPCGSRGIVCLRDQSEEEVSGAPMLLVPEDLLLTSEVARWVSGRDGSGALGSAKTRRPRTPA